MKEKVVNGKTIQVTEPSDIPGLEEGLAQMREDAALNAEVNEQIVELSADGKLPGKTADNDEGEGGPAEETPKLPDPSTPTEEQDNSTEDTQEPYVPQMPNVDYSKQKSIDIGVAQRIKAERQKFEAEREKDKPDLDFAASARKMLQLMFPDAKDDTEMLNGMFDRMAEEAGFDEKQRKLIKPNIPPYNKATQPNAAQQQNTPEQQDNSEAVAQAAQRIYSEGNVLAEIYPGFDTRAFLDANKAYVPKLVSGEITLAALYKTALENSKPAKQQPKSTQKPAPQDMETPPPAGASFGEPFGEGSMSDEEYQFVLDKMHKGQRVGLPKGRK
jgi:hypothetical protein